MSCASCIPKSSHNPPIGTIPNSPSYFFTGPKKALYATKDFPGATGPTSFDDHGDVIKPIVIRTIKKRSVSHNLEAQRSLAMRIKHWFFQTDDTFDQETPDRALRPWVFSKRSSWLSSPSFLR